MTELERVQQLERQLKSVNRWLTLALLFIKLATLLMAAAIILVILGDWRYLPAAITSLMCAGISIYCRWAAGSPPQERA